jgi:hypothetical protein
MQASIVTLLATVFFVYVSKDWFWWVLIGVILLFCVCFASLWLTESPKYLLKQGRKHEAI